MSEDGLTFNDVSHTTSDDELTFNDMSHTTSEDTLTFNDVSFTTSDDTHSYRIMSVTYDNDVDFLCDGIYTVRYEVHLINEDHKHQVIKGDQMKAYCVTDLDMDNLKKRSGELRE